MCVGETMIYLWDCPYSEFMSGGFAFIENFFIFNGMRG